MKKQENFQIKQTVKGSRIVFLILINSRVRIPLEGLSLKVDLKNRKIVGFSCLNYSQKYICAKIKIYPDVGEKIN